MGDEALGVYSASWYSAALDTRRNKRFVRPSRPNTRAVPASKPPGTYVTAMYLESACSGVSSAAEYQLAE